MSAPERIWLLWANGAVPDRYHASAKDHTEEGGYPEFIRLDIHEAAVAAARVEGMREAAKLLHWMWNADGTVTERRVAEESAAAILKAAESPK